MPDPKPDLLDRLAQGTVLLVGVFAMAFGAFMVARPLDWYAAVPTVATTGPPNQHFIRDVGMAYVACGIFLFFAALNLRTRWLAAVAGALWLSLHGAIHIYEVSVGICGPKVFFADAPGVLGPPFMVLVAVATLFARGRVALKGN